MRLLSPKQKEVFSFIRESILRKNLPPTLREIAVHFGFSSTGTVRDYLESLCKKGYIKLNPRRARAIELIKGSSGIPVLGRVSAGHPKLAEEDIEGYIGVDELMIPGEGVFALRVKGDSMSGAGILEGDIVVVRRLQKADEGDIVVALIHDEATVKFFRRRGKKYVLAPANDQYKEIVFGESFCILGKVITVIRKYA